MNDFLILIFLTGLILLATIFSFKSNRYLFSALMVPLSFMIYFVMSTFTTNFYGYPIDSIYVYDPIYVLNVVTVDEKVYVVGLISNNLEPKLVYFKDATTEDAKHLKEKIVDRTMYIGVKSHSAGKGEGRGSDSEGAWFEVSRDLGKVFKKN